MFLAEGFEEVEALAPLDLLRRAGINVKTVGIGGTNINGAHGICVKADMVDSEYNDFDFEMVILPGGMPGTLNLDASDLVHKALACAVKNNAYIAAICAAPSILGKKGLLEGRKATCYPVFEDKLKAAVISKDRVVKDGNIITATGMGVAVDFGLLLVKTLCGEEKARDLGKACGSLALMTSLCRTASGVFNLENGVTVDDLKNTDDAEKYIIPSDDAVSFEKVVLTNDQATRILNGLFDKYPLNDGVYRVYNQTEFWGIGVVQDGILKIKAYVR
jgi:4-methyl-5(b-hydroxyethyl)-thiazole monophosphate biosynthesis